MTRRYEFVGGSSNKFWESTVSDNQVVVRYGRNGTNGQTITKTFPNDQAAERHANRLVAQKLGKGYVEVT
jgi:predicted DNA-binding WGR domain protein